jgi:hypothetical protein
VWRSIWFLIGCDCQKKKKVIAMRILETDKVQGKDMGSSRGMMPRKIY